MYTEREVLERVSVSRGRLHQLRRGRIERRQRKDGNEYTWEESPSLVEGKDFRWKRGRLFYTAKGLRKLLNRYGGKENEN